MKRVILERLELENFKGRTMSFDFSDGVTVFRGTNEAGKSSLTNAFFWLFMGVDAEDKTNYELYDRELEFAPENAIPAVVQGTVNSDGIRTVFKRVAKQKWVRKRGKSEYEKAPSDEYTFYIDGLAVSANIYKERVEAMFAPIDKLKLMLNVRYYLTLDWKILRKHFADMVGIIDESELKGDYSAISGLLQQFQGRLEDVKTYLKQLKKPIDRETKELESKIKGNAETLIDISGVPEAEQRIAEIKSEIEDIDKEIMGLGDANRPFIEKRRKEEEAIRNRKLALDGERMVWDEEQNETVHEIIQKIQNLNGKNAEISNGNDRINQQRLNLTRDIERDEQHLVFLKEELERLRGENARIKARTFDENQVCPSCGQPLPYDKIAEIREQFYNQREADHKAIVERGLKTKEQVESLEKAIIEKKAQIKELPDMQKALSDEELEIQLEEAKSKVVPFEQSEVYAKMTKEIAGMEANLTVVPEVDASELTEKKNALMEKMESNQGIVALRKKRAEQEDIIANNKARYNEIRAEQLRLEKLLDVCTAREREWASIVRDRANKHLHYSHVEMTELTKAGELVDVCTLTARKVPSGTQNNATKILIGVDVARAFQTNAGVNLPIFIDNAEGIVDDNLPDCDNQLFLMYVDKDYKQLTIC